MALREREDVKENMTSKLIVKSALVEPAKVQISKRAALGELGNKLPITNKNVPIKKPGAMGPPLVVAKKQTTLLTTLPGPRKELKRVPEKSSKPILKRQESILKTIPVDDKKTTNKDPRKSYSSKQLNIIDPDESSKNEPQMVTEYLVDIFSYLRDMEDKYPIRQHFLEGHDTTSRMRSILVNWLVEVHMNFKLYLETLHLCVAIVDRYLQDNKHVGRSTLQLVGASAMLIASKYEEMYIPDLTDFVFICDNSFSEKQILQMERDILKKLDFSLGRPLSVHFLRRYNKIAQVRSDHHTLGKYILELALQDYDMCHIKPSLLAAATCCLAMGILNEVMDLARLWTPTLVHYTVYEYSDFRHVITSLGCMVMKAETSKFQAIRKKYASSSYAKISMNIKLNGPLIRKLTTTMKK